MVSIVRHEIATLDRDPFSTPWGGIITPRDETLATRGGHRGIWIYDDIERDPTCAYALEQRIIEYTGAEVFVDAPSKARLDLAAADFIREWITQVVPYDDLCADQLDATNKGFSVGEAMWVRDGRFLTINAIKPRDQRRFVFDTERNLRLLTREDMLRGIALPDRKFIVHRYGGKADDPYGRGLGSRLFWPVLFKRQDLKFWLIFADKYGSPTAIGRYPDGLDSDDPKVRGLHRALESIRSSTGLAIPEGMVIDYLQLATSGSTNVYEQIVRYMDEQIILLVHGELSGEVSGGAQAAAAIERESKRRARARGDGRRLVNTQRTSFLRWLVEINFPGAAVPLIWRDLDDPEDLNARANRDKVLFDMGFRPTLAQIQTTYGGDYHDLGADTPVTLDEGGKGFASGETPEVDDLDRFDTLDTDDDGKSNVEFAAEADMPEGAALADYPDQRALDRALDVLASGDQQALIGPVVQPLIDYIAAASSLDAVRDTLAARAPTMDSTQLEALLARLFFVAGLAGRISATQELQEPGDE